jgi:hypothetical protein
MGRANSSLDATLIFDMACGEHLNNAPMVESD